MFPLRLSATLKNGEVAEFAALLSKSLEIFLHVPVGSFFEPFLLRTGLECLLAQKSQLVTFGKCQNDMPRSRVLKQLDLGAIPPMEGLVQQAFRAIPAWTLHSVPRNAVSMTCRRSRHRHRFVTVRTTFQHKVRSDLSGTQSPEFTGSLMNADVVSEIGRFFRHRSHQEVSPLHILSSTRLRRKNAKGRPRWAGHG